MIWAPLAGRACGSTGTGELHWAAAGAVLAGPAVPVPPERDGALAVALAAAGADATVW